MPTYLGIAQELAPRLRMDETVSAQRTIMNRFILSGLRRIQAEVEWPFLVERDYTLAISAGSRVLGLPSNFAEIVQIWIADTGETPDKHEKMEQLQTPIPKETWDVLYGTEFADSSSRGRPRQYTIEWTGGTAQLVLVPPSDDTYTLHLDYRLRLADLSADADTNYFTTNYPNLVVTAALLEGGLEYLNETQKYPIILAEYRDKLSRAIDQSLGISSRGAAMTWDPKFFKRTRLSA